MRKIKEEILSSSWNKARNKDPVLDEILSRLSLPAHFLFVQLLFLAWLHLSGPGQPGVLAQCDAELPSHNPCAQDDFFVEADPEVSSLTLQLRV